MSLSSSLQRRASKGREPHLQVVIVERDDGVDVSASKPDVLATRALLLRGLSEVDRQLGGGQRWRDVILDTNSSRQR